MEVSRIARIRVARDLLDPLRVILVDLPAIATRPVERGGNILQGFRGFYLENGSSQGQKLVLTVLVVPSSLHGGFSHDPAFSAMLRKALPLRCLPPLPAFSPANPS